MEQLQLREGDQREGVARVNREAHNLLQIQIRDLLNVCSSHLNLNIPSILLLNITYSIAWQFSQEGMLRRNIDFLCFIMAAKVYC